MEKPLEIRWHGRGGQGAKTAAVLFAESAIEEGKYGQGFPDYGPERMGAPMRGFTRIHEKPILVLSQITNPEIVAVLDQTLLDVVDVTEGLPDDGVIIVNTQKTPVEIRKELKVEGKKVCTVDATKISLDTLGKDIPNTVMIGAIIRATEILDINTLIHNIDKKFTKKYNKAISDANVKAIKRAYDEVNLG
jgi:pyruvate ferredoxin oxidoreductase gamma subunit